MSGSLRIAYFAHSLRSDWNNGNAHFLRGLMRALGEMGHDVLVYEPCSEWSIQHLREEYKGEESLFAFAETYPDLHVCTYKAAVGGNAEYWRSRLHDRDVVILHEWNPPALARVLLDIRAAADFRLLFHDTHHRASSSPQQIDSLGVAQFDGVLCFGESLRQIYQERFGIQQAWVLHEAADTTIFRPQPNSVKTADVIWVGNWGDDERSREIREYLLQPAAALPDHTFVVHGVRYPDEGIAALETAGVRYAGYLPNLDAPDAYAAARLTVHIPRQQYTAAMTGIPTIRVFEALACGIPLISAPWRDSEHLFREGDFLMVRNGAEMKSAMTMLLEDKAAANEQALRGLETILARHTCRHRAEELTSICEETLL
ncbi:MAG TPA: glycosyltransferase [Acidobacteriaceae bacterium]|nr:glycosyltransferase [Acidobacteriaceae bacterium]